MPQFLEFLDRRLGPREIRFVCLTIILSAIVVFVVAAATWNGSHTIFGTVWGVDYPQFHVAGLLLNRGESAHLYDLALQNSEYHRLFPDEPSHVQLPFVYAPFLAACFRPLALLPYEYSYSVWLAISIGCFVAGFSLIWKLVTASEQAHWSLCFLVAIAYEPLIIECFFGGQISTLGFLVFASVIYLDRNSRPFTAGLVLAVCSYKPTLLVLVLPMLLISRAWRILIGFGIGMSLLLCVSLLVIGSDAYADYVHLLAGYSERTASGFRTWKNVDVVAFYRLIFGTKSLLAASLGIGTCVIGCCSLGWIFRRRAICDKTTQPLFWGCLLTWSLVLNVYSPIYDTILIIPSAVLTYDGLCRTMMNLQRTTMQVFKLLLLLLFLAPLLCPNVTRWTGLQTMTLVLTAFGLFQLVVWQRMVSLSATSSGPTSQLVVDGSDRGRKC